MNMLTVTPTFDFHIKLVLTVERSPKNDQRMMSDRELELGSTLRPEQSGYEGSGMASPSNKIIQESSALHLTFRPLSMGF